ncbi:helix-turn-helix domain-containing protein [Nocardia sp. SYP-A9097]|uniref:AraC family transcriptional regulator n=1 Tax=Nocardia sp. SYP-A9097 TaxID=2663237 RepID=UPI00129B045A|nr:AraC family transcriptional regulator [Nocardia sp. SYP-A9097]MRH88974.1 helix-turn-helix domain-containing protein [Nocardia sp. SYP-A9097]
MSEAPGRLRAIHNAALLVEFGAQRGLAAEDVLAGTRIELEDLGDAEVMITCEQEYALMRNLLAGCVDEPGLGLLAGMLCHPTSLGIWGFALSTSSTLRQALEIGVRYLDLSFAAGEMRLETRGTNVVIIRDDSALPPELRRFTLERDMVAIGIVQQDLLPMRLPAIRLELALPAHPMYEAVSTLLGVSDLIFDAGRSALTLPASALEMPLPQANPASMKMYEEQCAEMVQRRRNRFGVSEQVRELLIHHHGLAEQSDIAADLNISVRTLRCRLAAEGTTFRELSSETIGLLAEELLGTGLTVESVADRLGYASVSAFGTAFRTWRGQTPGQYARANRLLTPMRGLR